MRFDEVLVLLVKQLIRFLGAHIKVKHPLWCVRSRETVAESSGVKCVVIFKVDIEEICHLLCVICWVQLLGGIEKVPMLSLSLQVYNYSLLLFVNTYFLVA